MDPEEEFYYQLSVYGSDCPPNQTLAFDVTGKRVEYNLSIKIPLAGVLSEDEFDLFQDWVLEIQDLVDWVGG